MKHNQIHIRAEFFINEGKMEEYKNLVQDMSRAVEVNEAFQTYNLFAGFSR
ncbi:MAG: hypothetical protein ACRD8W_32175 [Nitrososphaeraceae archaeon]